MFRRLLAFRFAPLNPKRLSPVIGVERGKGAALTPAAAKSFPSHYIGNVSAIRQPTTSNPSIITPLACEAAGDALSGIQCPHSARCGFPRHTPCFGTVQCRNTDGQSVNFDCVNVVDIYQ